MPSSGIENALKMLAEGERLKQEAHTWLGVHASVLAHSVDTQGLRDLAKRLPENKMPPARPGVVVSIITLREDVANQIESGVIDNQMLQRIDFNRR